MTFLAFLVAATLLAVTPGPGMAYVVARTVAGGRSEGLASCLGTGLGGMLHVAAAALGLSLLIAESAMAFEVVKAVGAAYLVVLGVRMLLRQDPVRGQGPAPVPRRPPRLAGRRRRRGAERQDSPLLSRIPAAVRLGRRAARGAARPARQHLRRAQHGGRCRRRLGCRPDAGVDRRAGGPRPLADTGFRRDDDRSRRVLALAKRETAA
jgi:hypothetical protein